MLPGRGVVVMGVDSVVALMGLVYSGGGYLNVHASRYSAHVSPVLVYPVLKQNPNRRMCKL